MERDENGLSVLFQKSTPGDKGANGESMGGSGMTNSNGMTNGCGMTGSCSTAQLAMVYSPMQCFRMLYSPEKALMRGTMFEELDKPLEEVR